MRELSILAILFVIPMAYAEQVDLPFEATGSDCIETESLTTRTFACVWMAPKEFGISVIQEGLDELDRAVLEGIEILKANGERYPLPPDQWKKEQGLIDDDKPRTTTDWIREKACESEREADKELCNHLNQLSKCEQGVKESESEPVSTYRAFVVSDGEISKTQNFDLQDNQLLRNIYLKIEECYAIWQVLQPTVLGEQYLNFIRQSDDLQPYHADMTTREAIRTDKLTDYNFKQTKTEAQNVICYYEFYDERTKQLYGCPQRVYDGQEADRPNTFKQKIYSSDPMEAYQQYKDNPNSYRLDGAGNYIIIKEVQGDFAIEAKR